MSKKKKKRKDACDLPPEGLWISPNDYRHADTKDLRDVAVELIEAGWTRYRYLNGTYLFEVDNAKKKMALIEEVLSDCGAHEFENVTISQLSQTHAVATDYSGTVADVYDRAILRFQSNPKKNKWRLS